MIRIITLSLLSFYLTISNADALSKKKILAQISDLDIIYNSKDVYEGNNFGVNIEYTLKNGDRFQVGARHQKIKSRDIQVQILRGGRFVGMQGQQARLVAATDLGNDRNIEVRLSLAERPSIAKTFSLPVHYFTDFDMNYSRKDIFPGSQFLVRLVGTLDDGRRINIGSGGNALKASHFRFDVRGAGNLQRSHANYAAIRVHNDVLQDPFVDVRLEWGSRFSKDFELPVHFNVHYKMNAEGRMGASAERYNRRARDGRDGRNEYRENSGEDGEYGDAGRNGFRGHRGEDGNDFDIYASMIYLEGTETEIELMKLRIINRSTRNETIRYYDPKGGSFELYANGGQGGTGSAGQDGGRGGDGGRGNILTTNQENSENQEREGFGGHGGDGGNGGDGGQGGDGGDGGNVIIYASDDARDFINSIRVFNLGGEAGRGGNEGCGGRAGNGGNGGLGKGERGRKGRDGRRGDRGYMGRPGDFRIVQMTNS